MNDKPDDVDPNGNPAPIPTSPKGPSRTLKLKGPRIERPPPAPLPSSLPKPQSNPTAGSSDDRPNFLTRIDQVKRQMQADMDALADPKSHGKKRP